ncbi:TfoX/Sxy family protein [Undibacterium sp. TS12]|uniref:TfoX/Sxy family protein n=1 Tax=Undibacterium sp. TS12 TaxID=2908202 RepID=UPI001F4CB555|nr:TfoX/Sxy family protein [Undibacterium sp. TS12]MCH8622422.1 TfoX/Sxy family protein [Undibacterium sp. TS12]
MARDPGLEELIADELDSVPDISSKPMFGGLAWLLKGKLLCGARADGMLVRLGKGNDAWALAIEDIQPMLSRGRAMPGWVRAGPEAYGEDKIRRKLIDSALQFVLSLPE